MTLREPLGRRPPAATGRQVDCREAKALADLCALGPCQTAGDLTTQPTALQATREPPTLPRLAVRLALNEAQLGVARAVPAAAAWGQCRCMILAGMNSEGTGAFLVRDATCCSVPVAHPVWTLHAATPWAHRMRSAMAPGRLSRRPWYSSSDSLSKYTLCRGGQEAKRREKPAGWGGSSPSAPGQTDRGARSGKRTNIGRRLKGPGKTAAPRLAPQGRQGGHAAAKLCPHLLTSCASPL